MFKFVLSTLFILFCFSCKSITNTSSSVEALITNDQFEKAIEIISSIDYLPFTNIKDGCGIRSVYMSMELAVYDIPSSAQLISVCKLVKNPNPKDMLQLPNGTAWNWHVAPLVILDGQEYIFDPAVSQKILKREEWKKSINLNEVNTYFELFNASEYFNYGIERNCNKDLGKEKIVKSFTDFIPFSGDNVVYHCSFMHTNIEESEDLNLDTKTQMQAKLVDRTAFLIRELNKKGKLNVGYYAKDVEDLVNKVKDECVKGIQKK